MNVYVLWSMHEYMEKPTVCDPKDEADTVILFSLNRMSGDGTTALNTYTVSENAEFLEVGSSTNGSDWVNVKVIWVAVKAVIQHLKNCYIQEHMNINFNHQLFQMGPSL